MRNLDGENLGALEDDVLAMGAGQRVGVYALELASEMAGPGFYVDGCANGQRLDVLPVGASGRLNWLLGRLLGRSGERW
jgi:hypothetical protein